MSWKSFDKVHTKDVPKLALALQDFQFCHLGGKQFDFGHDHNCTGLAVMVTKLWKQDILFGGGISASLSGLHLFKELGSKLSYQMAMFPLPLSLHHSSELGNKDWHSKAGFSRSNSFEEIEMSGDDDVEGNEISTE
ncbi:hypothetical protein P691DRAFT_789480 [Macrolepiota fuliginosa MF-IS2]|uniref:Uncharacterized protein n=1 Tax=Macrolepiota fuliginosa MF-IS2 TaxID=1400762 RepID=A0A9P6BYE2_9AGAR|nr:hypothetical protein P691DRAFT_789480 [Macrolepiota fuliginosa MF-IS2]